MVWSESPGNHDAVIPPEGKRIHVPVKPQLDGSRGPGLFHILWSLALDGRKSTLRHLRSGTGWIVDQSMDLSAVLQG